MFIIVVGGGKVGTYLARALLVQDHEVVVIEKNPKKAQLMANLLETDVTMLGDGCDPVVLDAAGIKRADVVVADTGDDEDNLVVCLIAKKHSKARCIARVNNPKNKTIFESIDGEQPITLISSTEVILDTINQHVNAHDYAIITKLKDGDLDLVKLAIPAGSPADGKRIVDVGMPRSSIVVAVDRKGEDVLIPNGDTLLRAGARVILMVKNESREDVRAALVGTRSHT
ncbi:MAG: NAD-binding protein [Candidatus Eremiobacteraeota bacterium]|nr:NAD-binding protein [Candidatus Eremiobacteraeota bacterium]